MPDTTLKNVDIKNLSANFYDLLGVPLSFDIDKKLLRKNYQALMASCHPDRFVANSDADNNAAIHATAHVTEAFDTLSSAPKRAAYLLKLLGGVVDFNANLATDTHFLMEQLEMRERLEEIISSRNPDEQVQALLKHAKGLQLKEGQNFQALYEQLKPLSKTESWELLFQKAHDSVLKLRFLEKLFEEIDAIQHKLLD